MICDFCYKDTGFQSGLTMVLINDNMQFQTMISRRYYIQYGNALSPNLVCLICPDCRPKVTVEQVYSKLMEKGLKK
jgi:hypothetical protein